MNEIEMMMDRATEEARLYTEFMDISASIRCEYSLELVLRNKGNDDTVARSKFISKLNSLYDDMIENDSRDFRLTSVDVSEDMRGITLKSHEKGHIIMVASEIKKLVDERFTLSF